MHEAVAKRRWPRVVLVVLSLSVVLVIALWAVFTAFVGQPYRVGSDSMSPTVRSGDTIVVNFAAANRDDAVFPEADRCVLERRDNRHLGFGAGVHRCLGSNLARLEFQVGVERVLGRLPDVRLAERAQPDFHGNSITRGFRSVPVVFTPGVPSTS